MNIATIFHTHSSHLIFDFTEFSYLSGTVEYYVLMQQKNMLTADDIRIIEGIFDKKSNRMHPISSMLCLK